MTAYLTTKLLCITTLFFGIALGSDQAKAKNATICMSASCVKAAAYLLNSIDISKDPCNNFFEYACGQWKKDNPIPDDMSTYGTFSMVRESVSKQIKLLLEKNASCSAKSMDMVKIVYQRCMDIGTLNKLKSQPLISALQTFGNWPLLDRSWTDSKFDMTDLLARIKRDYGVSVFIRTDVSADFKNATNTTLSFDQGILGLGYGTRDYYLNDTLYGKQMAAYKKLIMDTIRLLTTDSNITITPQMETDADNIITFERELAKITVPQENRRNASLQYNKWPIKNVTDVAPFVDWFSYFKIIMPSDVFALASSPQFLINVNEPGFIANLQSLIKRTDKKTLVNYVIWRFIKSWSPFLDARYDDMFQDFAKSMYGREEKPPRWKRCVSMATDSMDMAAGALYVNEYFKKSDKTEALAMVKNIQDAFRAIVGDLDWMDNATKQTASEKADAMIHQMGYPDFILNNTALDEYYSILDIKDSDSYFDVLKKVTVYDLVTDLKELLKPFDRQKFVGGPSDVNAYYSPERNTITFPAGILQPPFFKGDFPKAINYGAVGAVIGHEITHGFDDEGSQYDKIGNLKDWWSASAAENFKEKTKCIINQYGNYTVTEINANINGKLTQGENIADNGGIKQAYQAYKKYLKDLGDEEPRLPGLQFLTNEQIFFLSFANFWCGQAKPEYAVAQLLTDPHSPYKFRIIGTLSNFEEFSKAFQCPKNSLMNPDSRCSVW